MSNEKKIESELCSTLDSFFSKHFVHYLRRYNVDYSLALSVKKNDAHAHENVFNKWAELGVQKRERAIYSRRPELDGKMLEEPKIVPSSKD